MSVDLSGARWFKSSHSSGSQECVEVGRLATGMVGVRDSKSLRGPILVFTAVEWDTFIVALQSGNLTGK
ncbi:DUF397 domain-containing protein [Nocardia cyriacigeorgica]|uniref:DUF397 domain-containing protein n=1 Tax=Nocardia cyriacigeorgica TaxID=135487 RepID=UPI002457C997|nr:DUF397 domain-containing protein [Nocardia cyriacigeorgica]